MKRNFIIAALLAMAQFCMAQMNVKQFIDKYSKLDNADVINVDQNMLSMAQYLPGQIGNMVTSLNLTGASIVMVDNIDDKMAEQISTDIKGISDESYAPLYSCTADGITTAIMSTTDGDFTDNLFAYVYDTNDKDFFIIDMQGRMPNEILKKMTEKGDAISSFKNTVKSYLKF